MYDHIWMANTKLSISITTHHMNPAAPPFLAPTILVFKGEERALTIHKHNNNLISSFVNHSFIHCMHSVWSGWANALKPNKARPPTVGIPPPPPKKKEQPKKERRKRNGSSSVLLVAALVLGFCFDEWSQYCRIRRVLEGESCRGVEPHPPILRARTRKDRQPFESACAQVIN